ncbi:MAG: hypothetical protein ABI572_08795 [Actinomycetota bacterium]
MPALRSILRPFTVTATAAAMLAAAPAAALAAIDLTPPRRVSAPSSWTVGNAIGRSDAYLHTAGVSDCPPPTGACATDSGPFVSVFWQRSQIASAPRWSDPKRVSPAGAHAVRPSIATAGTRVYVAWATQTSYLKYRPKAPRRVWIRVGSQQGGSWSAPVALSGVTTRADYPVVAASGSAVWVVWTAADTGAIRMATSADAGASWTTTTIGTTTSGRASPEGFAGYPAIGASGSNLLAAWFAAPGGRQVALTSDTGGDDWSATPTPTRISGASPNDGNRYPVVRGADDGVSDRVAVGYTTATGVAARVFDGVTLSGQVDVDGPWPVTASGHRWAGATGASIAPFGADGLAAAYAACRSRPGVKDPCLRPDAKGARIDVIYRESSDGGASWSSRRTIARATRTSRVNEAVSLQADGPSGLRWFTWLGRTNTWTSYRVLGRSARST